MKLLIKQRILSWTDAYKVLDEHYHKKYEVRAELISLTHQLHVYDAHCRQLGVVREKLLAVLPTFTLEIGGRSCGRVSKQWTLLAPRYELNYFGWTVKGDCLAWNYEVFEGRRRVAHIHKEFLAWTDTYVIDIADPADELPALMLVIAIDAVNCTDHH